MRAGFLQGWEEAVLFSDGINQFQKSDQKGTHFPRHSRVECYEQILVVDSSFSSLCPIRCAVNVRRSARIKSRHERSLGEVHILGICY
jgi:hypothetical protein